MNTIRKQSFDGPTITVEKIVEAQNSGMEINLSTALGIIPVPKISTWNGNMFNSTTFAILSCENNRMVLAVMIQTGYELPLSDPRIKQIRDKLTISERDLIGI